MGSEMCIRDRFKVIPYMFKSGMEVSNNHPNKLIFMELSSIRKSFLDVMYFFADLFSIFIRHLPISIKNFKVYGSILHCMDLKQSMILSQEIKKVFKFWLLILDSLSNHFCSIMTKSIIKFNGVLSPSLTNDPIFVVYDISLVSIEIFMKCEFQGISSE